MRSVAVRPSREFRIREVRARRLDLPMTKPFGIAGGAQDLARNVIVEIHLESGTVGYGEAAPFPAFNGETQDGALAAALRATEALVGADVRRFRPLADQIHDLAFPGDAPPSAAARCALEIAVLDALTRALGVPMSCFFGGAEDGVVTDVTITTGTLQDAVSEARTFAAFRTLKIKVGGGDVDHDVARVVAVHEARPDAALLLDANGGFATDDAVRLAAALHARGIVPALFEQPVAPGAWEALAEVRGRTRLRVAADESVTRAEDVIEAHAKGAVDAVNVKLMKSGIVRALDIAHATRACGLLRMIGGLVETRLAMGTSACLAAGLGGFAFVDLDTPLFLAEDPWDGGYEQKGERIDLTPIGSGHGCHPRDTA
jgi:L-Ala-D/L-Glu epimerase